MTAWMMYLVIACLLFIFGGLLLLGVLPRSERAEAELETEPESAVCEDTSYRSMLCSFPDGSRCFMLDGVKGAAVSCDWKKETPKS